MKWEHAPGRQNSKCGDPEAGKSRVYSGKRGEGRGKANVLVWSEVNERKSDRKISKMMHEKH